MLLWRTHFFHLSMFSRPFHCPQTDCVGRTPTSPGLRGNFLGNFLSLDISGNFCPIWEETSKVVFLHSRKVLLYNIWVVRICLDYSLSIFAGETQKPKIPFSPRFLFSEPRNCLYLWSDRKPNLATRFRVTLPRTHATVLLGRECSESCKFFLPRFFW